MPWMTRGNHMRTGRLMMSIVDRFGKRVALIPDRFAHYRAPVFRLIGDPKHSSVQVTVFADMNERRAGIRLANPEEFPTGDSYSGTQWKPTFDVSLWKFRFQCGVLGAATFGKYDTYVFWGDAGRPTTWVAALTARLRGKRVLFWTHGLYGSEKGLKKFIRLSFYRIAHGILLYGDWSKKLLESVRPSMPPLWVIYNSLDVVSQLEIVRSLKLRDLTKLKSKLFHADAKVLAFVGRLNPSKKLELLFQAVKRIREEYSNDIRLLIIGDGPEKEDLVSLAHQLGIWEAVHFYGAAYNDEITIPLLAMSDILVAPGEVGLTAMHALVAGTPVITHSDMVHQMPEAEAVQDGVNGGTFDYGSVSDLASTITRVLTLLEAGEMSADKCREIILKRYHPAFQKRIFESAVLNEALGD